MHILYIGFENARENGSGELDPREDNGRIAKWTLLPTLPSGQEMLRLIAVTCGGTSLLSRLPFALGKLRRDPGKPLQVECALALHAQYDDLSGPSANRGTGVRIEREGEVRGLLCREYRRLPLEATSRAGDLLEEMAARDLDVCFTHTLDLRLVDQVTARLLKRMACSNLRFTRRAYHFSLNDCRNLDEVSPKYRMIGFANRDNVELIFMYGMVFGKVLCGTDH